jgi:predicted nucleic acid-binding Zn ribbon protein
MRSVAHLIPAALSEVLRAAPLSDGKVEFAWRTVAGPALGRATQVKLERGVLLVEATGVQWAREVRRSSSLILGRLQEFLGKDTVKSITVREHHTR